MTPVTRSLTMRSPKSPARFAISIFMRYPQRGASELEVSDSVLPRRKMDTTTSSPHLDRNSQSWARGVVSESFLELWSLLQKPGTLYEVPSIITSLQGHSAAHLGNTARIMTENTYGKHLAILCVLHKSPARKDNKNAVSGNL
jgi:hypothetical protein